MNSLPEGSPLRAGVRLFSLLALFVLYGHPTWAEVPESVPASIDLSMIDQPYLGDLDGMIERRHIRVLTVYSKTFYYMDKGHLSGLAHDISRQFEAYLNEKLKKDKKHKKEKLKMVVTLIPVRRDELFPALMQGRGDIAIANLTVTSSRSKDVDFTNAFYTDVDEIVVGAPGSKVLGSADELSGKTVFVRASSSYYESLLTLNESLRKQGKSPVIIRRAPEVLESEDLVEMVNASLIDYTVMDKHIALLWSQIYPSVVMSDKAILRERGYTAWAIRKESPQLKKMANGFLAHHAKGSLHGNVLIARYYKNPSYLHNVSSKREVEKFHRLVKYFHKYGERYSMDWLLMAAQGYQESRLDQSARSHAGAIGVMQVLPSTAKQLNVGDITKTENNIHAGVKYMRWMMDRYYREQEMTEMDKMLFTFASYNAGPRRIAELREEARRRHLDHNVWFQNVEYVASEKIGHETVNYVSNIFKYYVAYSLIMESQPQEKEKYYSITLASH